MVEGDMVNVVDLRIDSNIILGVFMDTAPKLEYWLEENEDEMRK